MKKKLTSAPILGFPDWKSNEMFRLYTDASKDFLGSAIYLSAVGSSDSYLVLAKNSTVSKNLKTKS